MSSAAIAGRVAGTSPVGADSPPGTASPVCTGSPPAIQAAGLTKSYAGVTVLGGVDLSVPVGSVFALLGPNGAGKTTMVRILATLLRPDSGTARVAGFDIIADRHRVRRSISLTGQDVAVDELQSGEENLRMMGRLTGLTVSQSRLRASQLLERFDLVAAARKRISTYSGGMRRRLDLAAGLVGQPAVIFLDEPTTGLDPRSRQDMWQVITDLVRTGVSVLLTTQYLEEADRLADTIAVINGGVIVAQGTPAMLKKQVADQRLELTMFDQSAFDQVRRELAAGVLTEDAAARAISVATDGTAGNVRGLLDQIDPNSQLVRSFALREASLDDVFLALTGQPASAVPATAHYEDAQSHV
ncbi:MAG: ATP-binding cassette domain-containing protein [Nakamurella sp.]